MKNEKSLTLEYMESIFDKIKKKGYVSRNLIQFAQVPAIDQKYFIMRFDMDGICGLVPDIIDLQRKYEVFSTIFVQVSCNLYNPFDYHNYPVFKKVIDSGNEIGLHCNFVEFAQINSTDVFETLNSQLSALRSFFPVFGIAPHRDLNYMFNSLPYIDENWIKISSDLNLVYHAYQDRFLKNSVYINEGFRPHMTWRDKCPEECIEQDKNIYMTLHPNWWYKKHIHERYI